MRYLESMNSALHELMGQDDQVVMIGEDLNDPYGGAFKVSKGLSTAFSGQIYSTPISEQAITGAAIGMSMRGMKPIVEIMFGDFLTLCIDQIVNHATKYHWMFNEQVNIPIVIRTPMGGGRGYGPTHSQSLENLFMSVPGLQVIVPSILHDPGTMLKQCVQKHDHPVLFVEHKSSYPKELIDGERSGDLQIRRIQDEDGFQDVLLSMYPEERPDVLLVTYGGMVEQGMKVAVDLFMEEEILVEVMVCSQLRKTNTKLLIKEVEKTGKVLVLEEGHMIGGWGSEISSLIHENAFDFLHAPVLRVGAKDMPIPSAMPLEEFVLPSEKEVKKKIYDLMSK